MARLSDTADAELRGEFAAIRARLPTPWGRFVWPRLVVLPRSFARFRRVTGGACVWWFWVVADPALADAPVDARRFVLAHEWGHVARGHAARLLAFWTLCFPLVWIHMDRRPGHALRAPGANCSLVRAVGFHGPSLDPLGV